MAEHDKTPGPPSDPSSGTGPAPAPLPKPVINAPSIIDIVEDEPCPNCKTPLATSAVVCLKCGFDMVAGKVRSTVTGVETVAKPVEERGVFTTPGRGEPKLLFIVGGVLLLLALVAVVYFAPKDNTVWKTVGAVAVVFYQGIFHTGTGALAVAATAFGLHWRLGRVDLLIARMFVAFSAFLLIRSCNVPLGEVHAAVEFLVTTARWVMAMGVYWLIVLVLFRKAPIEAAFVGGVHALLILFAQLATFLEATQLVAAPK